MPTPRPYIYQDGTVTLVNGSADVVGVGTAWTAVDYADLFARGGDIVPVLEVVDDTHITLALVWPGAGAAGVAYAITAGISATDPRRYGWLISESFAVIQAVPADAQAARDAAQASAADANVQRIAAVAAATLSQDWASKAPGLDVTSPGTRSSYHYSYLSAGSAVDSGVSASASAASAVLASDWSSKDVNTDVTTPGTRSAYHWSETASANVAAASASTLATAIIYRDAASASATLANDWANKAQDTDVTTAGTRSAKHWSLVASANITSAVASSIALASGWAAQPYGENVAGALTGSRSSLHYSTVSYNYSLAAAASVLLAADWASKGVGLDVNGTGTRSSYHWSVQSATSAVTAAAARDAAEDFAAAAEASAVLLQNPDFGFITDVAADFQDFGTIV